MQACTVLNGTKTFAYPKPGARAGEAVPLEELFTRTFPYDAFALAHAIPDGELPYRVTKEDYLRRFPDLRFVVLFADLDWHSLEGEELEARKLGALESARELGSGLWYPTTNGIRMAWRIDCNWREYQHLSKSWYAQLEALFPGFLVGSKKQGVDHSANTFGRHMRLPFVRRAGVDQRPVLEGRFEFLTHDPGPLPPEPERYVRPRGKQDNSKPANLELLKHALAIGLAAPGLDGKTHVYCPTRRHSNGGLGSCTVILPDGRFKCLKAGCEHVGYSAWAATIPSEYVTLTEAEAQIETAIRKGGIGQKLVAVDVPCGVGKSHVARRLLPPGSILEGMKTVLLGPTNALATQHREASGAEQHAGVAAEIDGRMACVQPKVIAKLHELGLSSKYACQTCPNREGCKAAEPIGDKAFGIVSTHAMLHRFNDGNLIVIDEMPPVTESFEIDLAEIPAALAACKRDWAVGVGAWASGLIEGRIDERAKERAQLESETPATSKMPTFGEYFDGERMAETFAPVRVASAVRSAAHPSSKIVFADGKALVTRLSEPLAYLQERGGTLLAAGASEAVLKAIRPDVEIVRVKVVDPPGVQRFIIDMPASATGHLVAAPDRIKSLVEDVMLRVGTRQTLFMCPKALESLVKSYTTQPVAHFGALRGLDDWKDLEAFVTIGDHFDNLGAVDAEADFLGIDAERLSTERVEIELGQAHGRARDPRRTAPCLHLHYGQVWPAGWTLDNAAVIVTP